MGIWSSILEFCRRWKRELRLYGAGLLLVISALATGKWAAACILLAIVIVLDAMHRWGEPWRELGEKEFARRQQANKEYWHEQTAAFLSAFQKDEPPPAETTRVISRPPADEDEDLPESPAPIVETEKPVLPPPPVVTHDT